MQSRRKYLAFALSLAISLGFDQWTKHWAREVLRPVRRMVVIDGFFDLHYSENPAAAFSLLRDVENARSLLLGIGALELILLLVFLWRSSPARLVQATALGMVAGGAIGNLVDRARSGVVTDFILWKIHQAQWPIFNIADAELLVGVLLLLFGVPGRKAPQTPEPTLED